MVNNNYFVDFLVVMGISNTFIDEKPIEIIVLSLTKQSN